MENLSALEEDELSRPRMTTGQTYLAFDGLIRLVETWVESSHTRVDGCDPSQVQRRIVQRIVQETAADFTKQVHCNRVRSAGATLTAGGLRICTATGEVSVSLRASVINVLQFTVSWVRFLVGLLRGLIVASPQQVTRATILTDVGGVFEESNSQFIRFCSASSRSDKRAPFHRGVVMRIPLVRGKWSRAGSNVDLLVADQHLQIVDVPRQRRLQARTSAPDHSNTCKSLPNPTAEV